MVSIVKHPWNKSKSSWDVIKVGNDLVEWSKIENSLNLNRFCAYYDPPFPVPYLFEWAGWKNEEGEHFLQCLQIAKGYLGDRRESAVLEGKLHVKPYDLGARAYDQVLQANWMFEERFMAQLKEEGLHQVSKECTDKVDSMIHQLDEIRSSLKIATSTINNEAKS